MVSETDKFLGRRNWIFWLAVGLFFTAPFHAFLVTWFRSLGMAGKLDIAVSAYREIFLVGIFLLALPDIFRKLRREFFREHIWIFLFFISALAFVFRNPLAQWMWGARYDLLPFFVFLLFWCLTFSEEQKKKLTDGILMVGAPIVIFGLLQAVILPKDFLVSFGYSLQKNVTDIGTAVSSCQLLEHTKNLCRAVSTFGGPARYGTYLLLLFFLAAQKWGQAPFFVFRHVFGKIFLVAILANIALTYSRSIYLGLFAGLLIFLVNHKNWKKITLTAVLAFAAAIFIIPPLRDFALRASSSSEHWNLMKWGWLTWWRHPWGLGLGKIGPASVHFVPFLTENWYLQIAIETGFLGFFFFLAALLKIVRKSFYQNRALFQALLGISIAGLFSHSFEETTTMILLFALLGLQTAKTRVIS